MVMTLDDDGLSLLAKLLLERVDSDNSNPLTVGDGTFIASDGKCILHIFIADNQRDGIFLDKRGAYLWKLSRAAAEFTALKLIEMIHPTKPCHQYFDFSQGDVSTLFVSKGEYTPDHIRSMRDDP